MRRKSDEAHQQKNLERWLLTYADMITLLMAFFIMMYSMSVLNLGKFRQAAVSIRSGFGGMVRGQGIGHDDMCAPKPRPLQGDTAGVPWRTIKPLVEYIEKNKKVSAEIGEDARGIVITLKSDRMLFAPGSAVIRPAARPLLDKIARTIGRLDNLVQVEGHTCDLPPRSIRYASNWELSTARATRVLRYLTEKRGLDPWRFAAAGYGSMRPVAPNKSEPERSTNRRVEIVILRPEAPMGTAPEGKPRRISNPEESVIQRRLRL